MSLQPQEEKSQVPQRPGGYMKLSTATNPLTRALPRKEGLSAAQRAAERFSVSGNAIVTGGAGGLGFEACRALLEHGVQGLCIFDIASQFETSRDALRGLKEEFPGVTIVQEEVDVRDEARVEAAVGRAAETLGSLDVLLCFAGIAKGGDSMELAAEVWREVVEVNTTGSWLCARAVAKEMVKQGRGGSIVFTASIAGHRALFPLKQAAYCVSKGGVLQLTTSLAAEWAEHGIRVNSISPGYIDTAMTQTPGAEPGIKANEERNPMGRMGEAHEIAGPVIMLCSPAGRYITGVDIIIDGAFSPSLSYKSAEINGRHRRRPQEAAMYFEE